MRTNFADEKTKPRFNFSKAMTYPFSSFHKLSHNKSR
jgi:hypothetical protein